MHLLYYNHIYNHPRIRVILKKYTYKYILLTRNIKGCIYPTK